MTQQTTTTDGTKTTLGTPTEVYTRLAHAGARFFVVFPKPHLADPAWIHPVIEFDPAGGEQIRYTGPDVLLSLGKAIADEMAQIVWERNERKKVLAVFGLTEDDYIARLKSNADARLRLRLEELRLKVKEAQEYEHQLSTFADEGNPHHD